MEKRQSFSTWLDSRMPTLRESWKKHMSEYFAPKNFHWMYYFGVLAIVTLVGQLVTGIWLLMS